MPNSLLDLIIPTYDNGGFVDYDPYSYTTLDDSLDALGVELLGGVDARLELPTYDKTPQDMVIEGYNLREQGYGQALDTAQRKGAESLFGMTQAATDTAAQAGFTGAGAQARQMEDIRKSLVSDFGDTQRNIGLQRDESYLGLQRDIYNIEKAYQDSVMGALSELPEEDWRFKEGSHNITGSAEGQQPPTYAGSTPGQNATGGDGQQYTWINGEWVNTNEEVGGGSSYNIYTSVPSTNVGDTIIVNTGSGVVNYSWDTESNSYVEQGATGGSGGQDKI